MIDFPGKTKVSRRMPKEAFYSHLSLSTAIKAKFVSDLDKIFVAYSLKKENLNLVHDAEIKEILVLSIALKKQDYDPKILEAIARQNPHKLIFLIIYENQRQLAVYHHKLYRTPWMPEDAVTLTLSGDNLDAIWEDLVRQIALPSQTVKVEPLEAQLKRQDAIKRLEKLIAKTQRAMWKEIQPKKKFELHQKLTAYQEQLEELKQ
ncbi:MAG: DUF4391 domain-containing protein [Pseudoramibacter sp.]